MKLLTYILGLLVLALSLTMPVASASLSAPVSAAGQAVHAAPTPKTVLPVEKVDSVTAFFRTTKPGGENQLLGLLLSVAVVAGSLGLLWAASAGLGKTLEAVHRRKLTVFWLSPLFGCALYATFHVERWAASAVDLSIWGATPPAALSSFMLLWLIETCPDALRSVWHFFRFGLPGILVGTFQWALFAGAVALVIPALIPGVIAVVWFSVFLSVGAYYATRKYVGRTEGHRRLCGAAGHAVGALLCLVGQQVYGYSAPYLALVLQLYFAWVISVCWVLLWWDIGGYDPKKCTWVPVFLNAPQVLGWTLLAGAGVLAGALGLAYAAAMLLVCAAPLSIHWFNHRPTA